ncbi:hypothetical protein [Embleya sp. NPDC059237]|uniref:hypothetical protein n=1 Tax=Embleya sp. NPDC059237 TaxID=3346784 RepID=UPI0036B603DF
MSIDTHGLDDDTLDALLARADAELLTYARAHVDPTTVLRALLDEVPAVGESGHRGGGARRPVTWAQALDNRGNASRIKKLIDAYLTRLEDLERRFDTEADIGRAVQQCADELDTLWTLAPRIDVPHGEADLRDVLAWSRELFEDLTKQAHTPGTPVVRGRNGSDPAVSRSDFDRLHSSAHMAMSAIERRMYLMLRETVDVSGADLSGMKFTDLDILENVVWTDATRWHPAARTVVRECSHVIGEGVYRIHTEGLRDRDHACV